MPRNKNNESLSFRRFAEEGPLSPDDKQQPQEEAPVEEAPVPALPTRESQDEILRRFLGQPPRLKEISPSTPPLSRNKQKQQEILDRSGLIGDNLKDLAWQLSEKKRIEDEERARSRKEKSDTSKQIYFDTAYGPREQRQQIVDQLDALRKDTRKTFITDKNTPSSWVAPEKADPEKVKHNFELVTDETRAGVQQAFNLINSSNLPQILKDRAAAIVNSERKNKIVALMSMLTNPELVQNDLGVIGNPRPDPLSKDQKREQRRIEMMPRIMEALQAKFPDKTPEELKAWTRTPTGKNMVDILLKTQERENRPTKSPRHMPSINQSILRNLDSLDELHQMATGQLPYQVSDEYRSLAHNMLQAYPKEVLMQYIGQDKKKGQARLSLRRWAGISLTEKGKNVLLKAPKSPLSFVLRAFDMFTNPEETQMDFSKYGPQYQQAYNIALRDGLIQQTEPTVAIDNIGDLPITANKLTFKKQADIAGPGGEDWLYEWTDGDKSTDSPQKRKLRWQFYNQPGVVTPGQGDQGNLFDVSTPTDFAYAEVRNNMKKVADNDAFDTYLFEAVHNTSVSPWISCTLFKKAYNIFAPGDVVLQYGKNLTDVNSLRRRFGSTKKAADRIHEALDMVLANIVGEPIAGDSFSESQGNSPQSGAYGPVQREWDFPTTRDAFESALLKWQNLKRPVSIGQDTPDTLGIGLPGAMGIPTSASKKADKLPGGKGDNTPDSAFDKKALQKGEKVEQEHTKDAGVTKEIAKDHLTESPDYYDKLEKIEKGKKKADLTDMPGTSTMTPEDQAWIEQPAPNAINFRLPFLRKRPTDINQSQLYNDGEGINPRWQLGNKKLTLRKSEKT